MERLVMGRFYARFWFVFFSSVLVSLFFLFFLDLSFLILDRNNNVSFLVSNYAHLIETSDFDRSEAIPHLGIDPFHQQPNPAAENGGFPGIGEDVTQITNIPPPPEENGGVPVIGEDVTQITNNPQPPEKNGGAPAIGKHVTQITNNPPLPEKEVVVPAIGKHVTQITNNPPPLAQAKNDGAPAIGKHATQITNNPPPPPQAKNGGFPATQIANNPPPPPQAKNGGFPATQITNNPPPPPPQAKNGGFPATQIDSVAPPPFPAKKIPIPAIGRHVPQNVTVTPPYPPTKNTPIPAIGKHATEFPTVGSENEDKCSGRYVYVHDLPARFNDDVLIDCKSLIKWFNMCVYLQNSGLGPPIPDSDHLFSGENWYSTSQFTLEQIFRNRMKQYDCLTNKSSLASAVYVPVYIGLDIGRYLWDNTSRRDSMAVDLVDWLTATPEWKKMDGRDHFFVAGRISWDFRRIRENAADWGTVLMRLPAAMKMTMLSIEGTQWRSDFAIPYPTYFHPKTDRDVATWQETLRRRHRTNLFAFIGAPRPEKADSIREELIRQCADATSCHLLNCNLADCENPVTVMKTFTDAVFCLQPPGDSLTRRSAFDSILAGCIPVFFHPGSAYVQYIWHLPRDYAAYSVFIPARDVRERNVSVGEVLSRVSEREVTEMRENVIRMIPRVTYADPGSRLETMEDAFDIAVKGVLERVERIRMDRESGREGKVGFVDDSNWFWKLNETSEATRWASLFREIGLIS